MKRYMLDTNAVSHIIKGQPAIARHIVAVPMASLCISSITEGELLFGLAKRPDAKQLHLAVREFLKRVNVLPWESAAAECYGTIRAMLTVRGRTLAPLDLLIAAHALSVNATLVSNDQTFLLVAGLRLEDWSEADH